MNVSASVSPNTITVDGKAYVEPHTTASNKRVDRVYFTANDWIQFRDDAMRPDTFACAPCATPLLDWKGAAKGVQARRMFLQQPVRLTLRRNERLFWDLVSVEILGPCEFTPGFTLQDSYLRFAAQFLTLPPEIEAQVRENEATPRKGFFTVYPHGPWNTPTGRPEDLVAERPSRIPKVAASATVSV